MKKIFIILLVLFVGLLVGCASKPVVEEDDNLVESFFNSKVISKEDLNAIYSIYSLDSDYCLETNRTDFTIKIVNTTNEKQYFKFQTWHFDENGKCDGCRFFYSTVSPNDTGLFNLFDFITLGEDGLIIYVWDSQKNNYRSTFSISHYNFKEVCKTHSLEMIYDGDRPAPFGVVSEYNFQFIEPFECVFDMEYEVR